MTDHPQKSRWKHPRRILPILITAFIVLSVVAYRISSGSALRAELKQIRKRGLPISSLELDNWYKRVPATNNAALGFIDAYRNYVAPTIRKDPNNIFTERLKPGQPLEGELAEAVALYLEKNQLTLEIIHAAATLSASRYPIDLSKGPDTLLPHLANIKSLIYLLKWDAIQKSADGKREEALRSVHSGFALIASLRDEPVLISELVRVSCLSILLQAVERIVTDHQLTDQELIALGNALRQAEEDEKKLLSRSIVGERALGIPLFDVNYQQFVRLTGMGANPSLGDTVPEVLKATLFAVRRAVGIQHRDLVFYLQCMGTLERATEQEYPAMLRTAEEADEMVQEGLQHHRFKYLVSGLLLPALGNCVKKEVILAGRLRCAQMALAIERYRALNSGKLPSPNDLVPALLPQLPRDPVDDQPLHYELNLGKGYRILSAAATKVHRKGTTSTNMTDVAFTVVR